MRDLTIDEQIVLKVLGEVWNLYAALPIVHAQDGREFMVAIHAAQNIVLARPATEVMGRPPTPKVESAE